MTRCTWVCCNMTSLTNTAHGSRVRRQGRSRNRGTPHASTSAVSFAGSSAHTSLACASPPFIPSPSCRLTMVGFADRLALVSRVGRRWLTAPAEQPEVVQFGWRRWGAPNQLTRVVACREPQLEVHPRLAAPRLFFGKIPQAHQAVAPLDAPRTDPEREVHHSADEDRKEELGEAVGSNAECCATGRGTEPDEHADVPGVDVSEAAGSDRDGGEQVGDAEGDEQ